jgi:hypothetical protein
MKISKIVLVSILLLAILTLGAVSASDDGGNLTVAQNLSMSQSVDSDVIAGDNNPDGEVGASDEQIYGKESSGISNEVTGDFLFGEYISIKTVLPEEARGNVTYTFITDFETTSVVRDVSKFDYKVSWVTVSHHGVPGNPIKISSLSNTESYMISRFGNLNISVDYSGDDNYYGESESFAYFLNNSDYNICLETDNWLSWERYYEPISIITPYVFKGTLTVTINGKPYDVEYIENEDESNYVIDATLFDVGENNYTISYGGDDVFGKFDSGPKIATVSSEYDVYILSVNYGQPVYVDVPSNFNGTLTVTINGRPYYIGPDEYGNYIINESFFSYGINDFTIYYGGDDVFAEFNSGLETRNVLSSFKTSGTITWGDNFTVSLLLPDDATGNVLVYQEIGWDYDLDDYVKIIYANETVNGPVNLSLSNLPLGHDLCLCMDYIGNYPTIIDYDYIDVCPKINIPKTAFAGNNIVVTVEGGSSLESCDLSIEYYDFDIDEYVTLFSDTKYAKDGNYTFIVPGLSKGYYRVYLEYDIGDDTYDEDEYIDVYNRSKLDFDIWCSDVVVLGGNSWLYVDYPYYAIGSISAYIDGKLIETKNNVENDYLNYMSFKLNSLNLTTGNHTFEARFTSDIFENATYSKNFEVADINVEIPKEINLNVDYSMKTDSIIFDFCENMTGTVTIYLDDFEFEKFNISSYTCFISLRDIPVKDYDVRVVYSGDDKYSQFTKSGKLHMYYDIDVLDKFVSYCDEKSIIKLVTPYGLRGGNFSVTIDGKLYYNSPVVDDDIIMVNVSDLDYGKHVMAARYSGDAIYPVLEVNKTIDVTSHIKIPSQWGEDNEVSLTLPADAEGNLSVNIYWIDIGYVGSTMLITPHNVDLEIPLVDGKASLPLNDLELGTYSITCSYSGKDYNVYPMSNEFSMNAYVESDYNGTVGGSNTISIESPISNGELKVSVEQYDANSDSYSEIFTKNISLVNNKASYTFKNGVMGEYRIVTDYIVDGETEYHNSEIFYVTPDFSLNEDVIYEPVKNLTVTMPKDASGHVNARVLYSSTFDATVEEVGVFNASFEDGVAVVNLPKLSTGNYYVYMDVNTSNYGSYNSNKQLVIGFSDESGLKDADLKVDVSDINAVQDALISIEIDSEATGSVLIVVGDKNTTSTISNGKASASFSNLAVGEYSVIAKYYGDNKVADDIAFAKLRVSKSPAEIIIDALDSEVEGSNLQVDISIAGATGTVSVNGKRLTLSNGKASTTIENIAVGDLKVDVLYSGDDSYLSGNASKTVNVYAKKDSGLTASASDIKVGEVAKVIISIDKDVTGTVTVDGKKVTVSNGAASYDISGLKAGNYNVSVKFEGDKYFNVAEKIVSFKVVDGGTPSNGTDNPSQNASDSNSSSGNEGGNSDVSKLDSGLTASVSDINVGGVAKVVISIDGRVSGAVTVDGNVVNVVDGVGSYDISGLSAGDYNINVKFAGDAFFNAAEKSVSFKVIEGETHTDNTSAPTGNNDTGSNSTSGNGGNAAKPTPEIVIPPLDKPSSDGSVTVTLPRDATGDVTLSINGKNYSYSVQNGVANVVIPNLGDGNYPYTITYSGDSKYSSFTNTGSLNVDKNIVRPDNSTDDNTTVIDNSKITASNSKVTYANGKYYTIKVYGADGNLADGVKVVITVKGKTFKTLTTKDGIAKFKVTQKPGTYKLNITALNKSITKTLTVKHLVTLKSVTVKKSAKKLVLQATLGKVKGKYLKGKTITFNFNGKKYKAKTDKKGVAKVTIKSSALKNLKVGKKVTYQATYLKDTVKRTSKIKK